MTITNKMNYIIDGYNKSSLAFRIAMASIEHNTNYGTICMPTGYGKTSEMTKDMILTTDVIKYNCKSIADQVKKNCEHINLDIEKFYKLKINGDLKTRLVYLINSPILILNSQLFSNIIEGMIYTICKSHHIESEQIGIYIVSSAKASDYKVNINGKSINCKRIDANIGFINDINIVVSCNPSLYKFCNVVKKIKANPNLDHDFYVTTYLDEAHTLNGQYDDDSCNNPTKVNTRPNINKILDVSDSLYAFSATPDNEITMKINKKAIKCGAIGLKEDEYLVNISPLQAINEGVILPPKVMILSYKKHTNTANNVIITWGVCKDVLEQAKNDNQNIKHKILVSCRSTEELRSLFNDLIKHCDGSYVVFSTCSRYGLRTMENGEIDKNGNLINSENATKMSEMVSACSKDCFVLHVRQLICGIDISSLTDCILISDFRANETKYDYYVQVIGRILRCANGERGISADKRTKKHGNVFFLNPDGVSENDFQNEMITKFVFRVYGIDNITGLFGSKGHGLVNSSTNDGKIVKEPNVGNHKYDNPLIREIKLTLNETIGKIISFNHLDDYNLSLDTFETYIFDDLGISEITKTIFGECLYYYHKSSNDCNETITNIAKELIKEKYINLYN